MPPALSAQNLGWQNVDVRDAEAVALSTAYRDGH
jgi:hypothetical protein